MTRQRDLNVSNFSDVLTKERVSTVLEPVDGGSVDSGLSGRQIAGLQARENSVPDFGMIGADGVGFTIELQRTASRRRGNAGLER